MKRALFGILLLTVFLPALAGQYPERGDVILSAFYGVTAPTDATDVRAGGLAAGVEGFVAPNLSLGVVIGQRRDAAKTNIYELTANPRWGNFYFPVGLYGVEPPCVGSACRAPSCRNTPAWGAVGGIGSDWWNSSHLGIGFQALYVYLENTALAGNFYEARAGIRLKF